MKLLMIGLLVLGSCAVSKTKLSRGGKKVKVLGQAKNSECQVIDKVVGENEKGIDALAQNHARNLAADIGGDALYFDEMVSNGHMVKAHATVYQCSEED
ncbi:MAG: hypothetical protein CME65_08595 [Halobacteriovoraceae bacterium]|nr:hypothetical protein [Halobacteriovoraceae bacterium]|tara:strand:+ start:2693 stop:2989 length:297 start_codon:yes stop_codon:yes gene_type:complete